MPLIVAGETVVLNGTHTAEDYRELLRLILSHKLPSRMIVSGKGGALADIIELCHLIRRDRLEFRTECYTHMVGSAVLLFLSGSTRLVTTHAHAVDPRQHKVHTTEEYMDLRTYITCMVGCESNQAHKAVYQLVTGDEGYHVGSDELCKLNIATGHIDL